MKPGIITLTTDFGPGGPYVAAMKGILLGLAACATMIDVCHLISPQNVLEGAFVLAGIVDAFPLGSVHLAVVDPGVGTPRRLIVVKAAGQWFVLPDNGLITGILLHHKPEGVWEISNPKGLAVQRDLGDVPRPRHPGPRRGPPAQRRRSQRTRP